MKRLFRAAGGCSALAMVSLVLATTPANAGVLFDSLSGASAGSSQISSGASGPLWASFSTGAASASLTDVALAVGTTDSASGQSFSVGLYADNATSPGALLDSIGTVAESGLSGTPSVVDLTLGTPYALAAGTRYWIGVAQPAGNAFWSYTLDQTGTEVGTEYYVYAGTVLPNVGGPYQMQVTASATVITGGEVPVPEPAGWDLMAIGLLGTCAARLARRGRATAV